MTRNRVLAATIPPRKKEKENISPTSTGIIIKAAAKTRKEGEKQASKGWNTPAAQSCNWNNIKSAEQDLKL